MKTSGLIKWPDDTEDHQKVHAFRHVKILDEAISACKVRRTAVQAGGNVGLWPLRLSHYFQRVISFEPEPITFECLKHNVRDYGIEVHRKALGAVPMLCGIERRSLGSHRIIQGITVEMIALDSLKLEDLDFLQLDIEGSEYPALMGAQMTVTRCRPVIMLEFLSKDAEECCRVWLKSLSYKLHMQIGRDYIFKP